jgi:hypothetical protein
METSQHDQPHANRFAKTGNATAAVGVVLIAVSLVIARTAPCDSASDGRYFLWKTLLIASAVSGAVAVVLACVELVSLSRAALPRSGATGLAMLSGCAVLLATPTVGFVGGIAMNIGKCGLF